MLRYVTIPRFSDLSGYSLDAIRSKIRDDIWREGHEYAKAPDGRILIDTQGYEAWVGMDEALSPLPKVVLKSRSSTRASAAGKKSPSSPPPLT